MVAAALVASFAAASHLTAALIAQVGDEPVSTINLAFTGVGATTVVGVMAWIVKKVVSGEVGPIPIQTLIDKMDAIITRLGREDERRSVENTELREIVRMATEAMFAMHEHLRTVSRQDPPLPARTYPRSPAAERTDV